MDTQTVISKDGTTIAYDRYGAGEPVILVGGAFQHRAFDPQSRQLALLLAPACRVFHYDRRGRGESSNHLPYAVKREVEDLEVLIQAAGSPAYVFGMSSGAVLALEAAAAGLGIRKLALYEAPYTGDDEAARRSALDYDRELTALLAAGQPGEAAAFAMARFGTPPEMITAMRQSPGWAGLEAVAPTLAYDSALMGDGSVPAQHIAQIQTPALVMDGGDSPDFMHQAADALAAALPNAVRRTLAGQTHNVDPQVLAPVLQEFFLA